MSEKDDELRIIPVIGEARISLREATYLANKIKLTLDGKERPLEANGSCSCMLDQATMLVSEVWELRLILKDIANVLGVVDE